MLSFALTGVALKTVPAPLIAAARAAFGFAFAAIAVGGKPRKKLVRRQVLWLAVAGSLGMAAFLLFQVLFRYSNAPSGADIVFVTGLSPLLVLPMALFWTKERPGARQVFGVAIATLAMVAVLGNWETPSSLWLFTRFPIEEGTLLLSAVAWAFLTIAGRLLLKEVDPATQAYYVFGFASIVLIPYALVSGSVGRLSGIDSSGLLALIFLGFLGSGLGFHLWLKALVDLESHRASSALLLTPVLLTLYLAIDRKASALPIDLPSVLAGCLLLLIGFLAAVASPKERESNGDRFDGFLGHASRLIALISAVGFGVAAIGLFAPVRESFVSGVLDSGRPYAMQWLTSGFSTIGGYLLISISAFLAISGYMFLRGRLSGKSLALSGIISIFTLPLSWIVQYTPFSSWHSWMPAEIQQAIGTEYVRLQEIKLTSITLVFSAISIAIASIIAIAVGVSSLRRGRALAVRASESPQSL